MRRASSEIARSAGSTRMATVPGARKVALDGKAVRPRPLTPERYVARPGGEILFDRKLPQTRDGDSLGDRESRQAFNAAVSMAHDQAGTFLLGDSIRDCTTDKPTIYHD